MKHFLTLFSFILSIFLFIGCGGSKSENEDVGCSEPGKYGVADLDNFLQQAYKICKTKNDVKGYLEMGNTIFGYPNGATAWARDFLMEKAESQFAKYKAKVNALIGEYNAFKNDPQAFLTKLATEYAQKVINDKINELTKEVDAAKDLTQKSTQMTDAAKGLGVMKAASAISDVNNAIKSCQETITEAPQLFQMAKDLAPKLKNL